MGRLVDADALKVAVRKKFKDLPSRCEINGLVNAAPTIDAIPVEWLRNIEVVAEMAIDDRMFVEWLLSEWQKEQEVDK